MKKILTILVFVFIIALVGCVNNRQGTKNIEVDEIEILIDELPRIISEDDREKIIEARSVYDLLTDNNKALVGNYQKLLDSEAAMALIDEKNDAEAVMRQSRIDELIRLEAEITENIPELINKDIELMNKHYGTLGVVNITWSSSNPSAINVDGHITQSDKPTNVTLTAAMELDDVRHIFRVNIVIEENNVTDISELERIQTIIEALIPNTTKTDITLPSSYESLKGKVLVSWASNDNNTLSSTGIVNQGHTDKTVILTANMVIGNSRHTFEKEVIVEEIEFSPMPVGNAVFVYTYNSAHGFNEKAKQTIDVVNHAFGFIKDGQLDENSIKGREGLMPLRKAGIRLVLSVAGFNDDYSEWSNAAATQSGREKIAKSIVEIIVKLNYDGVDIDWESSKSTEKENFTLLMGEIRKQLKAVDEDYLFTGALGGGPWIPKRYNIGDLTPIFDYFLLMTYGMDSDSKSTHHVPMYYSKPNGLALGCSVYDTVNYYISQGGNEITKKLVVGAAFYGRKFTNTAGIGQTATRVSSPAYHLIKRDYIDKGFTVQSDDVAKFHIFMMWKTALFSHMKTQDQSQKNRLI